MSPGWWWAGLNKVPKDCCEVTLGWLLDGIEWPFDDHELAVGWLWDGCGMAVGWLWDGSEWPQDDD